LDELDKELNTYAMRVREWYGWHFPEMGKIINEPLLYAKVVKRMGFRSNTKNVDLSDILPEEVETQLKEVAEVSMGTEIADEDINNIQQLCDQVISISEYRTQLFEYLKNRMNAIAPNLSVMVGELVGARLIAHAGSLLNLAKHPASTVQILGAEKALFRALKTKHATPKYGIIYHASLVGQAPTQYKGKISRVLAAKTALSIRMDALGDTEGVSIGIIAKAKVEQRLKQLEGQQQHSLSGQSKSKSKQEKYSKPKSIVTYNAAADVTQLSSETPVGSENSEEKQKKKKKKKEKNAEVVASVSSETPVAGESVKPKKKRKRDGESAGAPADAAAVPAEPEKTKKKKKVKET